MAFTITPGNLLSMSFLFSAWGDRMWNFAVGLYLIKLTPGSLQLAAIYGMAVTSVVIVFAPVVGDWIDKNKRMKVIRTVLFVQNVLVVCSAVCIMLILFKVTSNSNLLLLLKVLIIVTGSLANLASQGEKIAVSKDWVVVLCKNDNDYMASLNAQLRRIDLTVAIIAPIAVGSFMSLLSDLAGIVLICAWNVLSVFVEYFLMQHVYKLVAELSIKTDRAMTSPNPWQRLKNTLSSWVIYRNQSIFLAGVALSMLYLTVLGFGTVTIGYAYSQSLKEVYVSIFFGAGSLFGILGTAIYPKLRKKFGLAKAGLCGFCMQWLMLLLCISSIWAPGSPSNLKPHDRAISPPRNTTGSETNTSSTPNLTSVIILLVGIVLSRTGLWITDLVITQLQQENVAENDRGNVGGVQFSFNSILDLIRYILTVVLPKPEQYGIMILISVCSVFIGTVVYACFYAKFASKRKDIAVVVGGYSTFVET